MTVPNLNIPLLTHSNRRWTLVQQCLHSHNHIYYYFERSILAAAGTIHIEVFLTSVTTSEANAILTGLDIAATSRMLNNAIGDLEPGFEAILDATSGPLLHRSRWDSILCTPNCKHSPRSPRNYHDSNTVPPTLEPCMITTKIPTSAHCL